MKKSEDLMKIRKNPGKKSGNRMNFRKRKPSYHIWEVNHPFCEEIWSKLLKYEDLRNAPLRKKNRLKILKSPTSWAKLRSLKIYIYLFEGALLKSSYLSSFDHISSLNGWFTSHIWYDGFLFRFIRFPDFFPGFFRIFIKSSDFFT